MTALAQAPVIDEPLVHIEVKMGEHLIADWTGPKSKAPAIEAGWSQRFGLGVTSTPIVDPVRAGVDW